jgi:hypothetical protein
LSDGKDGFMRCGKDGLPIVTAIQALPIPESAIELEKQLREHMPERQLLEAITNSEHWTEWGRHFGPPSRLSSQIKEATRRYVFELVDQWGTGEAAVADGTHFEIYEDNLLAEHHIRYGKTGGIAYRHIADNYIALFSRFIACGTYEATYILDAGRSPIRLHCEKSRTCFGLLHPGAA